MTSWIVGFLSFALSVLSLFCSWTSLANAFQGPWEPPNDSLTAGSHPGPPLTWSGAAHRQPVASDRDRKPKVRNDLYFLGPRVKFPGIIARCNFPAPLSAKCSLRAKHLVNYKEVPVQKCLQIRIYGKPEAKRSQQQFFFLSNQKQSQNHTGGVRSLRQAII